MKEQFICWITAMVFFFCAVIPTPDLCVCDNCPYANSNHSKTCADHHVSSSCCQSVGGTINGGDFCVCACTKTVTASLPVASTLLSNDQQNRTPPCFALLTSTNTLKQSVFGTKTYDSPISRLPVRLHLLLFVLLI
jgi:hypothetical protein